MSFDPYDQWLKIPPGAGPPSHYDLLGLTPFEADPQRIHDAGMERIADIRRYQLGPHGAAAGGSLAAAPSVRCRRKSPLPCGNGTRRNSAAMIWASAS